MPDSPETPTPPTAPASTPDRRNIATGFPIAAHGYCDQPYVVVNDDGSWCCVMTTGPGLEGDRRQHVVSTVSRDEGRTWDGPGYATYAPGDWLGVGARRIKHPRAAGFVWKCRNGRYLLWHHNHGGRLYTRALRTSEAVGNWRAGL
jgi:hypothetical protein